MDQISIYLPGILLAYATFFLAIASPGPNVLAIIGTSMSVGRRSGIALALGVAVGALCRAPAPGGGGSPAAGAAAARPHPPPSGPLHRPVRGAGPPPGAAARASPH